MPLIDSSTFFLMLFGSDELEPFIGKLSMAIHVECMNGSREIDEEVVEYEQRRREVLLAGLLRDRIQPFIDATSEEEIRNWQEQMKQQSKSLCLQGSFGEAIVEAVGWVYENYANQFIGKLDSFMGYEARVAKFKARNRKLGNYWSTAINAIKVSQAARSIQKEEKKQAASSSGNADTEPPSMKVDPAQIEAALPLILQTLLKLCLIDIESTIRNAAKKVLKDMSATETTRRKRAESLIILGKIMQDASSLHKVEHQNDPAVDPIEQVENALKRANAKADEERIKGSKTSS